MLSDSILTPDGVTVIDRCYHDGRYKGDHSECIEEIQPNCAGCHAVMTKGEKRFRWKLRWALGVNEISVLCFIHNKPECLKAVRWRFFEYAQMLKPKQKNTHRESGKEG